MLLFIKIYKLLKPLKSENISISNFSRHNAVKDLKGILSSYYSEDIKNNAAKIILLLRISNWIFFGCIFFTVILFFLNGIFKWQ